MGITVDQIRKLLDEGRYREAVRASLASDVQPEVKLFGAYAALCLGDSQNALGLLEELPPQSDPGYEADRLSLMGQAHYLQGDLQTFHRLIRQALEIDQSHVTLYFLGQSMPPDRALLFFRESLARARTPQEEGTAAYALARTLERLGRFREGLSYASLAVLRDPDNPVVKVAYAVLALNGGDKSIQGDLTHQIYPLRNHPHREIRLAALNILAELSLSQGNLTEALALSQTLIALVGKDLLPLVAWQAVRIHLALGQRTQALQVAHAAELSSMKDPYSRCLAQLALGFALFPDPQAEQAFVQAVEFATTAHQTPPATVARLYLANLRHEAADPQDIQLLDQWSDVLHHTLPARSQHRNYPYMLRTLGQPELLGPAGAIVLRPRSMELLVLLASRPHGWQREDLSVALYGHDNPNAIKVELSRLKQLLAGGIASNPWRIYLPLYVDFIDLQNQLAAGQHMAALRLFRGSLLPRSRAPGISDLRREIEETLREGILASQNTEALLALAELLPDDLQVWETLLATLPTTDMRNYAIQSRIRRLRDQL
jgi:tetratricopeptide (TPR) repeat protein